MKLILALCGTALVAACASAPMQPAQRVQSNQACDYALMDRIDRVWQPAVTQRYWYNCPQVPREDTKTKT